MIKIAYQKIKNKVKYIKKLFKYKTYMILFYKYAKILIQTIYKVLG